jgi:exodeoxyribonuclease-5
MRFSPQQDCALRAADRWFYAGDALVFRLFGYAGTGKTTLAKYLAEHVSGCVRFAAYTGKAAHVMRAKGCKDATTLHNER